MTEPTNPLPVEGVCGTLYLYKDEEVWRILTWDGRMYHYQVEAASLEQLKERADLLIWAKDWPRVECSDVKHGPLIRVEFEYADGKIQRLVGEAAQTWLTEVNGVLAASQLRWGRPQTTEHPWQWTKRGDIK